MSEAAAGGSGWPGVPAGAFATAGDARALWRSLGGAGLIDLVLPPSNGRREVDPRRLGQLLTELDARLPMGMVLSICVQVATVIPLLRAAAARSPMAADVLREALRGEAVVALAASDAGLSGSALLDARTEVRDAGDGVRLSGGKDWITNACICDHALVLARHRPARHFTSFSWVLVPARLEGVSCRPATSLLFDGAGLGHLRFDDVVIGREHVVGAPGRALSELALQLGTERLAGALWARALCRRLLVDTYGHLRRRSTGDGTLWDNAAIRERFARCVVEWRRLDALCEVHGAGAVTASRGMLLKAASGESVDRLLAECASLLGAEAFRDGGLAVLRAQAAMFGVAGGAAGAMLAGVAEHVDELLGLAG